MDVLPLDLTGDGALRAAVAADREVTRMEGVRLDHLAQFLGDAAAEWKPPAWLKPGAEMAIRLGGLGTPEVPEFAVCEVATAFGLTQPAATVLCADVLDLAYRLRRVAVSVRSGVLTFARARVIARRTRDLTGEQANLVQERLMRPRETGRGPQPMAALVAMSRLRSVIDQAVLTVRGPESEAEAELRVAESLYVEVVHETPGATDLAARLASADATRLDHRLDEIAGWLTQVGDHRPKKILRAVALGLLADPALLQALSDLRAQHPEPVPNSGSGSGSGVDASASGSSSVEPGSAAAAMSCPGEDTLFDAATAGSASPAVPPPAVPAPSEDAQFGAAVEAAGPRVPLPGETGPGVPAPSEDPATTPVPDGVVPIAAVAPSTPPASRAPASAAPAPASGGAGIAGCPAGLLAKFANLTSTVLYVHLDRGSGTWCEENAGVLTQAQARQIVGHANVTIRPVLDLAEDLTYTGYVAPPKLKEQLALLNAGYCTFPHCHRRARTGDVDHQLPAGQGGRTRSKNTHRLCRKHHRAKDKGRWRVTRPAPGLWVWASPAGAIYLVSNAITTPLNGILTRATTPNTPNTDGSSRDSSSEDSPRGWARKEPARTDDPATPGSTGTDGNLRTGVKNWSPSWDPWEDPDPLTESEHEYTYGLINTG